MNDDKVLVEKTLEGDQGAFEMIIRKYQTAMFNYVGRMTGDRELARDLTQDIFVKAYSSLHTYRPQFKFSTWLYKIASNTMIDFWRKKRIPAFSVDQYSQQEDRPDFQIPDSSPSITARYEVTQLRQRIEEVLKRIPAAMRELFIWRHINELSYEEIAEVKGIPVGTVKNRVFQAKEMIRRELERES